MYFIGWLRTRDGRTRRSGRASKGRVRRTSVQLQPLHGHLNLLKHVYSNIDVRFYVYISSHTVHIYVLIRTYTVYLCIYTLCKHSHIHRLLSHTPFFLPRIVAKLYGRDTPHFTSDGSRPENSTAHPWPQEALRSRNSFH